MRAFLLFSATLILGTDAFAQAASCPEPDSSANWVRVSRAWKNEKGITWSNDSLRRELIAAGDRDQDDRKNFGDRWNDTSYIRHLMAADSLRADWLLQVIDRFGFPTKSLVGARGSDAAMLIAQHNDRLRAPVLARAKQQRPGEVSTEYMALMEDRVRLAEGRPQLYGNNFAAANGGLFRMSPTEDMPHLEARRAAAGLAPLADYICQLEAAGMKLDRSSLKPPV